MFQNIGHLAVLNKVFNVRGNEWARVWVAWIVRFFYRLGFVLGWTVLVTLFVTNYGILSLPYLFLLNAVFTILGSFLFSTFIDKFEKWQIMGACLGGAAFLLFISTFFADTNMHMFFGLIIVTVGIFLTQFRILLYAFTEDLFSPLESERTFPVVESADIVGGIFAGLMVIGLVNFMEVSSFVYAWLGIILLTVPVLFYGSGLEAPHEGAKSHKINVNSCGLLTKFKKTFSNSRQASFISGLFLIVLLQWLVFNLLEFQYVRAVYQNVSGVILEAGSGFEHALVYDLGALFVLFSASALFVQLFLGSRIIDYLGIVGTMIVHGLLVLFSMFGLTLNYGFYTAVLAKNNFTVGTVLFTNVYHSSFYALRHNVREHVREVLEGIARPMGAIAGTFALIALQNLFAENLQIFFVNVSIILVLVFMLTIIWTQQKRYTVMAMNDLLYGKDDKTARLTAVDILAQKGHKGSAEVFRKVLFSKKEPVCVKLKILRVLPELNDPSTIKDLVRCLRSQNVHIRSEAIESLARFPHLAGKKFAKTRVFERYKLVSLLKEMYEKEENHGVSSKIIHLMAKLNDASALDFFIRSLDSPSGRHKAEIIKGLANFDDPEVADCLYSKLDNFSPFQKINAVIVLSGFKEFHAEAMRIVLDFVNSDDPKKIAYGIYAIGELKLKNKQKICNHYLYSRDENLKIHSAAALLKMGIGDGMPVLIDMMLSGDRGTVVKIKSLIRDIDVRILRNVDKIINDLANKEIDSHFGGNKNLSFKNLHKESLLRLSFLYELVGEYEYVENIDKHINKI